MTRSPLKSVVGVLLLGVLAVVAACKALPEKPRTPATADMAVCPLQTPEAWQQFLERYADNAKWVETCEDSPCDTKYHDFVAENVQEVFEQCAGFIEQHPAIGRCTSNMRRFTPVWLRQHDDDSYGFAVDNHAYLSAQTDADKPPNMMAVPKQIVDALPDRSAVEAVARKFGLKYLTHDSALKGSRTFVLISDKLGRFDQWMLLNLNDQGEAQLKTEMPFSILAVQKADKAGKPLPRVKLHFRDYTMRRGPDGHVILELSESNNGKCYSCHSNGVRQLISRHTPILDAQPVRGEAPTSDPQFAYRRLLEFNRKLRSYGAPDWDGMITPADNGPMLGQVHDCTSCHDGKSRNSISVFTSLVQLKQKVVTELNMPPSMTGPRLLEHSQMHPQDFSPEDAHALSDAYRRHTAILEDFYSSRLPALKQWFLETACR